MAGSDSLLNRRTSLIVILATTLLSAVSSGSGRAHTGGCPDATILQLRTADAGRGPEHWVRLLDALQAASISTLFVQWSVYEQTAFLRVAEARELKAVESPPLPLLLRLADARGMQVWVGLIEDRPYWQAIAADAATARHYLQQLRHRTLELLQDLRPLVAPHRSFAGWYIPQEVDDVNWRAPSAREVLIEHLRLTVENLRSRQPHGRIAISGFSNAVMDPESMAAFWAVLLERTGIDVLLFQDGVGVGKLELFEVPPYVAALRAAIGNAGRTLRVVVEPFTQTSSGGSDVAFTAEPAPFERLRQQIGIATDGLVERPVIFGAADYLTPLAGEVAGERHRDYVTWLGASAACQ